MTSISPDEYDSDNSGVLYIPSDILYNTVDAERERQMQLAAGRAEDYKNNNEGSSLRSNLQESLAKRYKSYDSLAEALTMEMIDAVRDDSLTNSGFPIRAMARAYVLKMISAEITGYNQLKWMLNDKAEIASKYGFEPDNIPDRTTFQKQWWNRYNREYREHIRFEAARIAAKYRGFGFNLEDDIEGRIREFMPQDDTSEPEIPETRRIENKSRDRVFNEFNELFNDVIDYDRSVN